MRGEETGMDVQPRSQEFWPQLGVLAAWTSDRSRDFWLSKPRTVAETSDTNGGEPIHVASNLDTHSHKEGRGGEKEEEYRQNLRYIDD